jgi:fatty-acyl-CoA synthase
VFAEWLAAFTLSKGVGKKIAFSSSGTTGKSKQIIHNTTSLIHNARVFNHAVHIDSDTNMYNCMPLTHMAGFLNGVVSPIIQGGDVVIGNGFNPLRFWRDIEEYGCNTVWLSPSMVISLLLLDRSDGEARKIASSMRNVFCGTAKLDSKVRWDWLDKFGIPLQCSYGTSELLLLSVQSKERAMKHDDCGELLDHVRAYVVEDEIVISGTIPWARYYYIDDDEFKQSSPMIGHDYRTGDIGTVDKRVINVIRRSGDYAKRGGVLINLGDIEDKVRQIEGVKNVAAVAVPHDYWGQEVHLFVKTLQATEVSGAIEKISDVPIADEIHYVDELPVTDTGKIMKHKLVETVR